MKEQKRMFKVNAFPITDSEKELVRGMAKKEKNWDGRIEWMIQPDPDHIYAQIWSSVGSSFYICLTYYKIHMKQWCLNVPNLNFGCNVAPGDRWWNSKSLNKHLPGIIDRSTLVEGIEMIFERANFK